MERLVISSLVGHLDWTFYLCDDVCSSHNALMWPIHRSALSHVNKQDCCLAMTLAVPWEMNVWNQSRFWILLLFWCLIHNRIQHSQFSFSALLFLLEISPVYIQQVKNDSEF